MIRRFVGVEEDIFGLFNIFPLYFPGNIEKYNESL